MASMSLGFLRGQHCPPPVLLLRTEQGKARASREQGTGEVPAEVGLLGRHTLRWGVVGRKFGEVWGQEGYRLRQRKGVKGGAEATKASAHGGAMGLGWACSVVTD